MNDIKPWAETPEQYKELLDKASEMIDAGKLTEAESGKWVLAQVKNKIDYATWAMRLAMGYYDIKDSEIG